VNHQKKDDQHVVTPPKILKLPNISSPSVIDILQETPTSIFRDEYYVSVPWLTELDLCMQDKEIIESNLWLTDEHKNAVNTILSNNTKTFKEFQDTKMTPYYIDNDKTRNTDRNSAMYSDSHDGNCHWTCSFSHESCCLYCLDSKIACQKKFKHLKFNVQILLCQIYYIM
jgi:hypothetical protein